MRQIYGSHYQAAARYSQKSSHRLWNIADEQFHGASQIVDLYHAREHYWTAARACFKNKEEQSKWAEDRRLELNDGNVEAVIKAIEDLVSLPGYDKDLSLQRNLD